MVRQDEVLLVTKFLNFLIDNINILAEIVTDWEKIGNLQISVLHFARRTVKKNILKSEK